MKDKQYQRILLAVSATPEGRRAEETAIHLAGRFDGVRLFVLHVVDKAVINRMKRFTDKSLTELEVEMEENGWKYLYRIEEAAKDQGIPTLILQESGVAEHILVKEAERLKADLIVLGFPSKTNGQIRRLAVGYIEKTLENATCDVLVVK